MPEPRLPLRAKDRLPANAVSEDEEAPPVLCSQKGYRFLCCCLKISLSGKTPSPREQQSGLAWQAWHFLKSSRETSSHLPERQHQCPRASALYSQAREHRGRWLAGDSSPPSGWGRKGCVRLGSEGAGGPEGWLIHNKHYLPVHMPHFLFRANLLLYAVCNPEERLPFGHLASRQPLTTLFIATSRSRSHAVDSELGGVP